MARKIIVVTAAYGNDHVKSLGGQAAVLPFIANAGADGVEIRRELCSAEELNALPSLAATIERHGLLACYARRRCSPTTASLTRISDAARGSANPERSVAEALLAISSTISSWMNCAISSATAAWRWW
ncbi:hypothetical protein BANRA_00017 [Klebsiella pneumoniae]|nr:hypothetical protein BANRA_00017 [Klebsiella pneumoniae]